MKIESVMKSMSAPEGRAAEWEAAPTQAINEFSMILTSKSTQVRVRSRSSHLGDLITSTSPLPATPPAPALAPTARSAPATSSSVFLLSFFSRKGGCNGSLVFHISAPRWNTEYVHSGGSDGIRVFRIHSLGSPSGLFIKVRFASIAC